MLKTLYLFHLVTHYLLVITSLNVKYVKIINIIYFISWDRFTNVHMDMFSCWPKISCTYNYLVCI